MDDYRTNGEKIAHWIAVPSYFLAAAATLICIMGATTTGDEVTKPFILWLIGALAGLIVGGSAGAVAALTTKD